MMNEKDEVISLQLGRGQVLGVTSYHSASSQSQLVYNQDIYITPRTPLLFYRSSILILARWPRQQIQY